MVISREASSKNMAQRKVKHGCDPTHPNFPHGKIAGYGAGCRCDECRAAKSAHRVMLAKTRDFTALDFPHGKPAGSSAGCKCNLCVEAKREYEIARLKKKDPTYEPNRRKHGGDPTSKYFKHGLSGYRYGCRCDACRKAHNESNAMLKKAWRAINHNGINDKKRAYDREVYKSEKGGARVRNSNAMYRAAKKTALLAMSETDRALTILIYQKCPRGYHVDHIVPISKGGEHAPNNLQYLPSRINLKKHNNEDFDCSAYVIRWQNILEEPSTTIPMGVPSSDGKRLAS